MKSRVLMARFSTDGLPTRDRVAIWREHFGRQILRVELAPQAGNQFNADVTAWMLPGLAAMYGSWSPISAGRTRALVTDGDDNLTLQMSSVDGSFTQLGREFDARAGDAVILSNADVGSYTLSTSSTGIALSLPRAVFRTILRGGDGILPRLIQRESPLLNLLKHQFLFLQKEHASLSWELQHVLVSHIYDLVALALGPTRDAADAAKGRGLRATRLQAIKNDILTSLHDANLSLEKLARRHGISPRYIRMLFLDEEISFSDFVRTQRLARAHRMLTSPVYAAITISAIAYDAGFSDLSHFNHAFRRAYGATPSDVRAAARRR